MIDYMSHFSRNPQVCNGHTVFKGTRVPLQVVLDSLAEGATVLEILEDYPSVTEEGVWAAVAFAAAGARNEEPWPVAQAAV